MAEPRSNPKTREKTETKDERKKIRTKNKFEKNNRWISMLCKLMELWIFA